MHSSTRPNLARVPGSSSWTASNGALRSRKPSTVRSRTAVSILSDMALVTETDRSSSAGAADTYQSTELGARVKVVHLHLTGLAKKP
jgi:hypothetical protein